MEEKEKKMNKGDKKTLVKVDKKFQLEYERVLSSSEEFFFSSISSKEFKAFKCKGCKKVIFPPSDFCPFCGKKTSRSDVVKISNDAKVFSQTTIHYPVPLIPDFKPPFSIMAFKISQTDTFVLVPSKNTEIYLGDRVKVFVKSKDRNKNMSDIEVEKL